MNKYKKALDCVLYEIDCTNDVLNKAVDILEELVEKAAPKKPTNQFVHYFPETDDYDYTEGLCPNCGMSVSVDEYSEYHYCSNCGQCINWSGDEIL